MQFSVQKTDLVRELGVVTSAAERKTTIPVLAMVRIDAAGDGLALSATDLEVAIRTKCAAEVKEDGGILLPAKRLSEYVRLLPDAAIDFTLGDNNWVSLKCGRSRTRIAGMSIESFPEMPEPCQGMLKLPVGAFSSLARRTSYAISAEESRFTLNGCLFEGRDNCLRVVATDGHRLALAEADSYALPGQKCLIPMKALADFKKIAGASGDGAEFWLSWDGNHIFFQFEGRVLACRKMSGNFPDYERVLPKGFEDYAVVDRDEFRDALVRTRGFADERSLCVRLQIGNDEVVVTGTTSETGEAVDTIPAETCGEVTSGFSAKYLLDFLGACDTPKVKLLFKTADTAMLMEPVGAERDKTICVLMPIRI